MKTIGVSFIASIVFGITFGFITEDLWKGFTSWLIMFTTMMVTEIYEAVVKEE